MSDLVGNHEDRYSYDAAQKSMLSTPLEICGNIVFSAIVGKPDEVSEKTSEDKKDG